MLVLVLAAALVMDPSIKADAPAKSPAPQVASQTKGASGDEQASVLAGVAVTLECTARASGAVENCRVLGETHPGRGFGEAAIALMRDVRSDPRPSDIQFARTIQFTP